MRYLFNYSPVEPEVAYPFESGTELLSNKAVQKGGTVKLLPWGAVILETELGLVIRARNVT